MRLGFVAQRPFAGKVPLSHFCVSFSLPVRPWPVDQARAIP